MAENQDENAPLTAVKAWERDVIARCENRCANCGSSERLRVRMVVPPNAGGQLVGSNGIVLCRVCEMAKEVVLHNVSPSAQRLVNFWVSRGLFDRLQFGLKTFQGFSSMGALVRYLIAKYIEDESRFDDLELFQDRGADVKLNVWVERDRYDVFKAILDRRGVTVTDSIKSLIVMHVSQTETVLDPRLAPTDSEQ